MGIIGFGFRPIGRRTGSDPETGFEESMDDLTEPDFRLTPNSVSAEHR